MILLSEIGDKTFFIAAILAMRHPRSTIFAGSFGALAVMTALSAALGWAAPNLVSPITSLPYISHLMRTWCVCAHLRRSSTTYTAGVAKSCAMKSPGACTCQSYDAARPPPAWCPCANRLPVDECSVVCLYHTRVYSSFGISQTPVHPYGLPPPNATSTDDLSPLPSCS
jgi:hypothetical protein